MSVLSLSSHAAMCAQQEPSNVRLWKPMMDSMLPSMGGQPARPPTTEGGSWFGGAKKQQQAVDEEEELSDYRAAMHQVATPEGLESWLEASDNGVPTSVPSKSRLSEGPAYVAQRTIAQTRDGLYELAPRETEYQEDQVGALDHPAVPGYAVSSSSLAGFLRISIFLITCAHPVVSLFALLQYGMKLSKPQKSVSINEVFGTVEAEAYNQEMMGRSLAKDRNPTFSFYEEKMAPKLRKVKAISSRSLDLAASGNNRAVATEVSKVLGEQLRAAAERGDATQVQTLLAKGLGPDDVGDDGKTALLLAVGRHRERVIDLLLEAGANPRVFDNEGNCALRMAVTSGRTDIATKLQANPSKWPRSKFDAPKKTKGIRVHAGGTLAAGSNLDLLASQVTGSLLGAGAIQQLEDQAYLASFGSADLMCARHGGTQRSSHEDDHKRMPSTSTSSGWRAPQRPGVVFSHTRYGDAHQFSY